MRCRLHKDITLIAVTISLLLAVLYIRQQQVNHFCQCVEESGTHRTGVRIVRKSYTGEQIETQARPLKKVDTVVNKDERESDAMGTTKAKSAESVIKDAVRKSFIKAKSRTKEGARDSFANEIIVKNLREITKQLVELRSTLDDQLAEFIDRKYDYFQRLLISLNGKELAETTNKMSIKTQRSSNAYVCPEEFKGTTYGYPFFREGFKRINCSKPPLHDLVTVILDNPCHHTMNCSIQSLIASFTERHQQIEVHVISNSISPAQDINTVIKGIKTPFVFIAPYLARYDDDIDIERLIDVLTWVDNAVAVGGSVKDMSTGEWSNGCQQIELREYTLYYNEGYHESIHSCLKCDILKGPFLIRTEFLKLKMFNEELPVGYYDDWFMRINTRGLDRWMNSADHHRGFALSCPDVMSRVTIPRKEDAELLPFAENWDIKRIINAKGEVQWFGCKRGIKHKKAKCSLLRGMSVPPCCLQNLADAINFIMTSCQKHGIVCELQEGTLMGAVKFRGVLHWERDADITFLTAHFLKLRNLKDFFKDNGYKLGVRSVPWCCVDGIKAGGVFSVAADGWVIEMYGQHKMESHKDILLGELPTKVDLANQMVQVPNNPGRYLRNRYGKEIYKHAEHWMATKLDSGWAKYSAGSFQECEIKGHHGCLDQFDADGNIQFIRGRHKRREKQEAKHWKP